MSVPGGDRAGGYAPCVDVRMLLNRRQASARRVAITIPIVFSFWRQSDSAYAYVNESFYTIQVAIWMAILGPDL